MLRRRPQPAERDGRVPRRNLNRRGRRASRRLGTRLERGRHEARACLYRRGQGKPNGQIVGTDQLGQPLLPREGEHAVGIGW